MLLCLCTPHLPFSVLCLALLNKMYLVDLLERYPMPLLLVVVLNRVMGVTPEQLLVRLQQKASSLEDPNPWLVQVGCPAHTRELSRRHLP